MAKSLKVNPDKNTILESIFSSSTNMAIAVTDLDFSILYYNPAAERLFGYTAGEVIGKTVMEIHTKEKVEPDRFEQAIKTVEIDGEYKYIVEQKKEDRTRTIESRVFGIWDKDDVLTGFVLMSLDISERVKAEENMIKSHERLMKVLDSLDAAVYVADIEKYEILYANKYLKNIFGEIEGKTCWKELQKGQGGPCPFCTNDKLMTPEGRPAWVYQWEFMNTAEGRWYNIRDRAIDWIDGRMVRVEIATDITERKEIEEVIKNSHDELEQRVRKRTFELESAVKRLNSDIAKRKKAEKRIRREIAERKKKERKLKEAEKLANIRARELYESNVALKVLLKQREQDRDDFENNILSNIKHLIMPYIEKLKKNMPMSDELLSLGVIESNLNEIISPFSAKLSTQYLDFTPREIQVADLVKDGKQDKDIMEILNVSIDTVKAHRKNIRKKLGIYGKRINLRTKLLSLEG